MMKSTASLTIAVVFTMLFAATSVNGAANEAFTQSCAQLQLFSPVFRCRSQTDACTRQRYECDSVVDCPDSSDEDHCATEHAESCDVDYNGKTTSDGLPLQKFQCDDGMCILGCYRCDNRRDCVDGSDERGCTENHISPPCY